MKKTRIFFKQSNRSLSGNQGAKTYAQVQRSEGWHNRLLSFIKVRGKYNGQN